VAAVRGTIVIMAHNPATKETLAFVFPSPGQSPGAARATFVSGGQSVVVTAGNFVRAAAGGPPGQVTPVGSLPAAVQAALTTAQNTSTANANELNVINVILPSPADIQNLVNTGGTGAGAGDTTTVTGTGGGLAGGTGACSGCGQDVKNNDDNTPPPQTCATPPCPPLPPASRR
jgi:hypothetical protein